MHSPLRQTLQREKNATRKKIITGLFFLFSILIILKGLFWLRSILGNSAETPLAIPVEVETTESEKDAIANKNEKIVEYQVSEGDIPAEVFSAQGNFNYNDIETILSCAKDVYDFTNIKIGQKLRFCFNQEDRADRVEYDKNSEDLVIIERNGDEFSAREEKIDYEVSQVTARGTIDNFFYVDALEAGIGEATVLEVGDIFSFDIDFTTEIQKGDEFDIVYEKRTRDGKPAPDGKILGAKFVNSGEAYFAYYFDNDGDGGYYDSEGRLLERQFLKAPLSYRYISSGYTGARLHPITKKISAHYQIDYAAPIGTPVVASANGTVTSAGWEGGWGNMIRLRHDNGYTSHYGHLSKYAQGIHSGTHVNRGEVIGYVGSTGWSTGPHLDYGIKLNGAPVNPLQLNLPKGAPISEAQMGNFQEIKNQYTDLLK
jgi:murein DD-endopeptidase MepM/ murein hydrolase activator NlpD